MGARPPHPLEQGRQSPRMMTGPDQPEPAILGRPEHKIVAAEQAEGRGDMPGIERRDIGPDEHRRAWRAGFERSAHPDPKIALALSNSLDPSAPMTGTTAVLVRRHGDPQP